MAIPPPPPPVDPSRPEGPSADDSAAATTSPVAAPDEVAGPAEVDDSPAAEGAIVGAVSAEPETTEPDTTEPELTDPPAAAQGALTPEIEAPAAPQGAPTPEVEAPAPTAGAPAPLASDGGTPVAPPPVTSPVPLPAPPLGAGAAPAAVPGQAPAPGFGQPFGQPPAPSQAPTPAPGQAPAPAPGQVPSPTGYYPQESFYAPGWTPGQQAAPKRRSGSRALLWSLIGVLGAALVVGVVLGALYLVQTRSIGAVTSATTVTTQQVRPGHCIRALPDDGSVGRVTLVPCSEPHEAQALSTIALRFDSWPGQSAVHEKAAGACEMSSTQAQDGFRAVVWTPTARSWGQGDKRALCIAWLPNGQYTGSFEDGSVTLP